MEVGADGTFGINDQSFNLIKTINQSISILSCTQKFTRELDNLVYRTWLQINIRKTNKTKT